jgi:hypothetical protein
MRGSLPHTVRIHEAFMVSNSLHEGHGSVEILIRLPAEAHDKVGGEGNIRNNGSGWEEDINS